MSKPLPSETIIEISKELSPVIDKLANHIIRELSNETEKIIKKHNLNENYVFYSIFKSLIHALLSPADLRLQRQILEDLRKSIEITAMMDNRCITKENIDKYRKEWKKDKEENIGYI